MSIKVDRELDEWGTVTAYFAKGRHCKSAFMEAVKAEVGEGHPCLENEVYDTWARYCRDFYKDRTIIVAADEGTRGAFRVMWIDVPKGR